MMVELRLPILLVAERQVLQYGRKCLQRGRTMIKVMKLTTGEEYQFHQGRKHSISDHIDSACVVVKLPCSKLLNFLKDPTFPNTKCLKCLY